MKWNRRAEYASALERAETRRRPEAESLRYKFSLREKKKQKQKTRRRETTKSRAETIKALKAPRAKGDNNSKKGQRRKKNVSHEQTSELSVLLFSFRFVPVSIIKRSGP